MRFKEWMQQGNHILSEMPTVKLQNPENMVIYNKVNGTLHPEPITADIIDFRFEDYKKFGLKAPSGNKYFAAPLANGDWINITMLNAGFGTGVIDHEVHRQIDPQSMKTKEYVKIDPDWSSFGEFLNGNTVVKQAPGEIDRQIYRTG